MNAKPQSYHAYLLRIWHVDEFGVVKWRAALEDARTKETIVFEDIDQMITFIQNLACPTDDVQLDQQQKDTHTSHESI